MKTTFRTLVLTTAAIAAVASSAMAAPKTSNFVRDTQIRLSQLGYYAGPTDGVIGEQTYQALMAFQTNNGLAANGKITNETSYVLTHSNIAANGYYAPAYYGYNGYTYTGNVAAATQSAWLPNGRLAAVQVLPSRFGRVTVNEDRHPNFSNYSVAVNGQPVLFANNQATPIRASKTFQMNGEDAVIFTSMDGTGGCNYRNYLVSVHSDGSVGAPREIGNCSGGYQASVSNGQLMVSFPTRQYSSANAMWDTWSYSGSNYLARL